MLKCTGIAKWWLTSCCRCSWNDRFSFGFRFRFGVWIFADRNITPLPSDILCCCVAPDTVLSIGIPTEVVLSNICVLMLVGRCFVPVLTSPSSLGFAHSSDVLDAWALARPGFCASRDRLSDLFCDPVYKFWSDYWCVFYLVGKSWLT